MPRFIRLYQLSASGTDNLTGSNRKEIASKRVFPTRKMAEDYIDEFLKLVISVECDLDYFRSLDQGRPIDVVILELEMSEDNFMHAFGGKAWSEAKWFMDEPLVEHD